MGFFQDISKAFNNTVGKAANVLTGGASQNVGNILGGKGNIGDILNLGLSAATGGFNGLTNIGKWNTGDFLQFLPGLLGGQGGQQQSGYQIPGNLSDLANQLAQGDLLSLLMRMPQRNQALDRAYNSLSPAGTRATANSLANQAQGRGVEAGRANANTLQRQGYGSGVQDAARLQGRNQGTSQGNSLLAAIMGPQQQSQNALMQSQIYSPANLQGGGLNTMLALQGAQNNQRQADVNYNNTRPNNTMENILGILPSIASIYLGQPHQPNMPVQSNPGGYQNSFPTFQQGVNKATSGYNPDPNYGIKQPKSWFDLGTK